MTRVFTQWEVCRWVRISYPTLNNWLNAGTFPQPVNGRGRGKRLLWTEESILSWLNQHTAPVNPPPPSISPAKQQKLETKAFEQRQEVARQTLLRHAAGRKGQLNNQPKERRS